MIKRTLFFENPVFLFTKEDQLIIQFNQNPELQDTVRNKSVPIEDIGVLVLDNKQVVLTHAMLNKLIENNTALITCNDRHMPSSLFLPLEGNTTQHERFMDQLATSQPLKKQLWQQNYAVFRKSLKKDGFTMFQYSIYTRCCPSRENAEVHMKRVKRNLPPDGFICVMCITDKQYGMIELFNGTDRIKGESQPQQLELF